MQSKIYKSLPSLVTIQAFIVCSERKSINKASLELNRSQGAVSKQIQQLEAFYDVVLFERLNSGLELTSEGRRFLEVAYELLEVVGKFELPNRRSTDIKIFSPSTFALRWLLPRIEIIKLELSEIDIQIRSTHADAIQLDNNVASLAIVRGQPSESNLAFIELFPEILTPMCSDSIRKSILDNSLSLEGQNLLHATQDGEEWFTWLDQNKNIKTEGSNSMFFDTLDVALSAAENASGIVIGDPAMAVERLESKRLFMPYQSIIPSGKKYYICYLEKFSGNKEIQQLVKAIVRSI